MTGDVCFFLLILSFFFKHSFGACHYEGLNLALVYISIKMYL